MNENGKIVVELGGKTRIVKFGLGATKQVCLYHNITLAKLAERFGPDDLFTEEIYGGLLHALALNYQTPDFSYAEVMEWIDEMPQAEMQRVFDCWLMLNQHGKTRYEKFIEVISGGNPTKEKKNLIGTQ